MKRSVNALDFAVSGRGGQRGEQVLDHVVATDPVEENFGRGEFELVGEDHAVGQDFLRRPFSSMSPALCRARQTDEVGSRVSSPRASVGARGAPGPNGVVTAYLEHLSLDCGLYLSGRRCRAM